jgi:hypothetical protein
MFVFFLFSRRLLLFVFWGGLNFCVFHNSKKIRKTRFSSAAELKEERKRMAELLKLA